VLATGTQLIYAHLLRDFDEIKIYSDFQNQLSDPKLGKVPTIKTKLIFFTQVFAGLVKFSKLFIHKIIIEHF
jgi:hypothetical protein